MELAGKTTLVTGATDGLGRALAQDLASAGADVLVHGRDPGRIEETAVEIRRHTDADRVRTYQADFSSLAEVRELARAIRSREQRLDVLINNAGIGTTVPGGEQRMQSADGYELRFAVNYLAGYLLTRELLELLKASAPARIVNVSSAGQMALDFDDLMLERDYSGMRAYCQSKLAQILFTFDLADDLAETGVTATCLHPATYMPTKIVRSPISTLEEGVAATRRLAADTDLEGLTGVYFNGLHEAEPHAQARDRGARVKLHAASEALVGPPDAA